jgi:hypothetical protein
VTAVKLAAGILLYDIADEITYASGTTFTLTKAPSTRSKVKMYINGIRITNGGYSLTSVDTITYDSTKNGGYVLKASPTADRIQFDYATETVPTP